MIEGICLGNIAIDCKNAAKLRQFYAELLGWEPCTMYDPEGHPFCLCKK